MNDDSDTEDGGRYGAIEAGNGDVIVYDRDEPRAWIQSSYAVAVGDDRQSETEPAD